MLSKVTLIMRGYTYEEIRLAAQVLTKSTYVRNIEITLNSENPYEIIKKISDEFGTVLNIGAGTVQTYDELVKAVAAGAKFVLSPRMMTKEMLGYCKEHNVISVPGSFTPSEIAKSLEDGADIVKVFPASELSYGYAKAVCEPMGKLPLMAVGGVNRSNVKEVFNSGYTYAGTVRGIFDREDVRALAADKMEQSLILFEQELS